MIYWFDIFILIPELFLLFSLLILLLFGVIIGTNLKKGFPVLDLVVGKLFYFIIFYLIFLIVQNPLISVTALNNFFIYDTFSIYIKFMLSTSFFVWSVFSSYYIKNEKLNIFEYWILGLLAFIAMFCLISSFDILIVYLCIEMQSLVFYVMASLKKTSEFSIEAGLKYFIIGAFSSALLLLGFSLLYGLTGLTHFEDFKNIFSIKFYIFSTFFNILYVSLLCVLIALLFKLSAAPFHMWSPDIYEGAPTAISFFFSTLPKMVITVLFIRFFYFSFYAFYELWQKMMLLSVILSLIFGVFGALKQYKWKRFIAFSSIFQLSFLLMGLAIGTNSANLIAIFYLTVYIIMVFSIFISFSGLRQKKITNSLQTRFILDIKMLSKVNPAIAFNLVIVLFSMSGIPPFAGFFAKILILFTVVQIDFINLVIFSILISCISCFYYLRIIKTMYFEKKKKWPVYIPIKKELAYFISIFSFFLFYIGLNPSILLLLLDFFLFL